MLLSITLFTKDPCPLCDIVKDQCAALAETYPHTLHEVDITQDHDTFAKYRFIIPVLHIGEVALKAPIHRVDLIRAFQKASGH
ncbi:MAG: glutaredoxin family protein [Ardenticatenaceae bacterium]|nr:glutaredoxin family protein [Ardenticatenaceae bacterium]